MKHDRRLGPNGSLERNAALAVADHLAFSRGGLPAQSPMADERGSPRARL